MDCRSGSWKWSRSDSSAEPSPPTAWEIRPSRLAAVSDMGEAPRLNHRSSDGNTDRFALRGQLAYDNVSVIDLQQHITINHGSSETSPNRQRTAGEAPRHQDANSSLRAPLT